MSAYVPPIKDMLFVLNHVIDMKQLSQVKNGDLDSDMVDAVLTEAGKLAADVLAPLNHSGDRQGCTFHNDGSVTTPEGFKEAYGKFCENGWNSVPFDPDYDGQGLPWVLTFAVQEMWQSANMAFGLCPLLNQAGIEALQEYGTDEQKNTYLPKMISGEWTGSMQLTEPQAGTDIGALRTKALPQEDGTYKISGQKIFITYGEHDFTENIIHMVLARTPDAPEGYKGISMFLIPKFIPDEQGNSGVRNDAYCTGIEHKLGIHASPTCTMQYGDKGGATGYLVGRENEGLRVMFVMMNNARLCVGVQGVAIAERAYQHAYSYANERVQGTHIDDKNGSDVKIIEHPDVRRMLLTMKAQIEAGRALTLEAGTMLDRAKAGGENAAQRVNLLTPVVKACCTDMANEVAAMGLQIHGGMGFIEETGAAQYVRDARILTIYEGTNGVQAQDLFVQKILRDKGAAAQDYFKELKSVSGDLDEAISALKQATGFMLSCALIDGAAVSVPYLKLFGCVAGAAMLLRSAASAENCKENGGDVAFCEEKIKTAQFYMKHILPQYKGYLDIVLKGSASVAVLSFRT